MTLSTATDPFIDPKSGNWLERKRRSRTRWHRRQGHRVEEQTDFIGLPLTVCWDCCMSWQPVWGTGDTMIGYHPKDESATRLNTIELLANDIAEIRGGNLSDRPDLRYLAQKLVDNGWSKSGSA